MCENDSTNQKSFAGPMFNVKLEEMTYKISFKALSVNPHRQIGLSAVLWYVIYFKQSHPFNSFLWIEPRFVDEKTREYT